MTTEPKPGRGRPKSTTPSKKKARIHIYTDALIKAAAEMKAKKEGRSLNNYTEYLYKIDAKEELEQLKGEGGINESL